MQISDYTVKVLKPEEGCFLTQADPSISDHDRVLSEQVFLAVSDRPENWREVNAVEAAAIRTRKQLASESAAQALPEAPEA